MRSMSSVVRTAAPSIARRSPSTLATGGAPAVQWRSVPAGLPHDVEPGVDDGGVEYSHRLIVADMRRALAYRPQLRATDIGWAALRPSRPSRRAQTRSSSWPSQVLASRPNRAGERAITRAAG